MKYRRYLNGICHLSNGAAILTVSEFCHGICNECRLRYICYTTPSKEALVVSDKDRFNATLITKHEIGCTHVRSVNLPNGMA